MATLLASFPNSRIKPRPATSQSDTSIVTCPTGMATLIAPANPNRTLITIRNIAVGLTGYYGYDNAIDGSPGANGGFELRGGDSADIQDPGDVYFFNNSGSPIDVSIDEGEG